MRLGWVRILKVKGGRVGHFPSKCGLQPSWKKGRVTNRQNDIETDRQKRITDAAAAAAAAAAFPAFLASDSFCLK